MLGDLRDSFRWPALLRKFPTDATDRYRISFETNSRRVGDRRISHYQRGDGRSYCNTRQVTPTVSDTFSRGVRLIAQIPSQPLACLRGFVRRTLSKTADRRFIERGEKISPLFVPNENRRALRHVVLAECS